MDPFPRMDIFAPVSSCNLFKEFPLGPSNFPTKLNYKASKRTVSDQEILFKNLIHLYKQVA